jgi:N12 class adenine-specific DNA methylase
MPETKVKKEESEEFFLDAIYKNAKMGADAIINLLPRVREDGLRSIMTMQLDGYEKYAARAAEILEERGIQPKEENIFTRLSAKLGVAVNTMIDASTSHIAEMMIEGSNMGITEMTRLMNEHLAVGQSRDALALAREMVAFEEHNLTLLKRYL